MDIPELDHVPEPGVPHGFDVVVHLIFDTVRDFLSFTIDFGDVSFTLWHFLLGGIALSIAVYFIQRILE